VQRHEMPAREAADRSLSLSALSTGSFSS
jgi:hypothetical protein